MANNFAGNLHKTIKCRLRLGRVQGAVIRQSKVFCF